MNWVFLALFAGIASNLANICNRYLLKDGQDSTVYAWWFECVRLIFFGCLSVFMFRLVWTPQSLFLLLAMGTTEFISIYFYMKMHKYSHLSISTILSRTRLIWIPLIAFFFIREHLKISTYIGIIILFIGLVIATSPRKLQFDRGQIYAYLSAFIIAINTIQLKENTSLASPSLLIVFLALPTSLLFPVVMKNGKKRILEFFRQNIWLKIVAGIANIAAIYLFTLAVVAGPVSIVNAIYQASMIIAVLAGIFILGEKQDITRKLIGSAVTIVGVILLSAI